MKKCLKPFGFSVAVLIIAGVLFCIDLAEAELVQTTGDDAKTDESEELIENVEAIKKEYILNNKILNPYANVEGVYVEDLADAATGITYNIWIPEKGSLDKPVIFCITGTNPWENERVAFGPHLVIKNKEIRPDAVVVIIQRKKSGVIENSYSLEAVTRFINESIIDAYRTSKDRVYYYGFSQGGIDFKVFGGMYNWRAAAFSDGYKSSMKAYNYCQSLKAIMYNNSTGTPSSWDKDLADETASKLGLVEGENYIWNVLVGTHPNINQYAVIQSEGQGYTEYSTNCTWKINEVEGLPMALNWLLQW